MKVKVEVYGGLPEQPAASQAMQLMNGVQLAPDVKRIACVSGRLRWRGPSARTPDGTG